MFLTHSPRATKEAGVPLEEMLALTTDWLKKCDVCCALESLHAWIILKCSHIHAQKGLSSSIRFLDVTWIESCLTELLSRPNRKKTHGAMWCCGWKVCVADQFRHGRDSSHAVGREQLGMEESSLLMVVGHCTMVFQKGRLWLCVCEYLWYHCPKCLKSTAITTCSKTTSKSWVLNCVSPSASWWHALL